MRAYACTFMLVCACERDCVYLCVCVFLSALSYVFWHSSVCVFVCVCVSVRACARACLQVG